MVPLLNRRCLLRNTTEQWKWREMLLGYHRMNITFGADGTEYIRRDGEVLG